MLFTYFLHLCRAWRGMFFILASKDFKTPVTISPWPTTLFLESFKVLSGIPARADFNLWALRLSRIPPVFISSAYFFHYLKASLGIFFIWFSISLSAPKILLPEPSTLCLASLKVRRGIFWSFYNKRWPLKLSNIEPAFILATKPLHLLKACLGIIFSLFSRCFKAPRTLSPCPITLWTASLEDLKGIVFKVFSSFWARILSNISPFEHSAANCFQVLKASLGIVLRRFSKFFKVPFIKFPLPITLWLASLMTLLETTERRFLSWFAFKLSRISPLAHFSACCLRARRACLGLI